MPRDWPQDWAPLTDQDFHMEWGRIHNELGSGEEIADTLELELARETISGHPLHDKASTALGYLRRCPNDFLFSIDDGSGAFAWVHLTWHRESDPDFPRCELYADWNEFLSNAPVSS